MILLISGLSTRWKLLLGALITVPLGFYSKFYDGVAEDWVNNSLSGIFYEIFWCFVLASLLIQVTPRTIAIVVFLLTCLIEILQLFDWAVLMWTRQFFIGKVLLGNSFHLSDFIYYAVGSLLGYFLIKK